MPMHYDEKFIESYHSKWEINVDLIIESSFYNLFYSFNCI